MHAYDTDFSAWAEEQAQALTDRRFNDLDLEHVIEEIEDLGTSKRDALGSQIRRLILHLLKWQAQPYNRSVSWFVTMRNARNEIEDLLEDNPSLRNKTSELISKVYRRAIRDAVEETGMKKSDFPENCPFTFEELMEFPVSRKDIHAA